MLHSERRPLTRILEATLEKLSEDELSLLGDEQKMRRESKFCVK
jgi:hypothetical protein